MEAIDGPTNRWLTHDDYDPAAADDAMSPALDRDLPDDPAVTLAKGLVESGVMGAPAQIKVLEKQIAELKGLVERNHASNEAVLKTLQTSAATHIHIPKELCAKIESDIQVHPHFEAPAIPQAPAVDIEPMAKVLGQFAAELKSLPGPVDLTPVLEALVEHQRLIEKSLDRPERPAQPIINDNSAVAKALVELGTVVRAVAEQSAETAKLVRKSLERLEGHVERQQVVQKSLADKLSEKPPEPTPQPKKNKKLTQQYDGGWIIEEIDAT